MHLEDDDNAVLAHRDAIDRLSASISEASAQRTKSRRERASNGRGTLGCSLDVGFRGSSIIAAH